MLPRDLLEVPELRLRLLVGETDELSRPVRWIYTTDLPDPARYLSGGELVISGMVWRHDPADSERFVAAGEALFPEVAGGQAKPGTVCQAGPGSGASSLVNAHSISP